MELNYDDQQQTNQVAGFIAKTFQILNDQQYSRIIYWSASGLQFVIKDVVKFQQIVLPKYFRHNKINSFIRQLNMYGFHKSRKQQTKCVFSHPLFQKNRQDLLSQIKRKIKQNDPNQLQNFSTPVKTNKFLKQQCKTTASGKQIIETKQNILSSCRQLSFLDNIGSSFKLLFDNKENLSRQSFNLNFSMNRISYNIFGNVQNLEQAKPQNDDDMISIENGIQKKQERDKQFIGLTSFCKFQNPSMFLDSFILKN